MVFFEARSKLTLTVVVMKANLMSQIYVAVTCRCNLPKPPLGVRVWSEQLQRISHRVCGELNHTEKDILANRLVAISSNY